MNYGRTILFQGSKIQNDWFAINLWCDWFKVLTAMLNKIRRDELRMWNSGNWDKSYATR